MRLLLLCFQLLALISSTFVHYLLLVTLSLNFATAFFISIIMNNCFWYAVSIPNLELVFLTNLDGLILSVSQQLSRKYYTPLRESFARRGKKFVTKKSLKDSFFWTHLWRKRLSVFCLTICLFGLKINLFGLELEKNDTFFFTVSLSFYLQGILSQGSNLLTVSNSITFVYVSFHLVTCL